MKAEKILHVPTTKLGEGPVWDYRTNRLWWVDIMNGLLHCTEPETGQNQSYSFDQYLGAAIPCQDHQLVLAMQHGFHFFDPKTGNLSPLLDPEKNLPKNRFNDGKCDPAGRFWAGTMPIQSGAPNGGLYCLETNGKIKKKLSNIYISNGLDWTNDEQRMFYIDTITQKVQSFFYDKKTGEIEKEKDFLHFKKGLQNPDGMTLDANDNLWIAFWDHGKIACYDGQSGKQLEEIDVPASNTTSCCFGGENLDTLFITTADKVREELGGALFAVQPGVKGKKANFFTPKE